MSLIKKPNEIKSNPIIKALFFGTPGIGKTTLAISAHKALLIDFDRGISRVKAQHRTDCVEVENYQEILTALNSVEINNYDTIVIDTLGKCVDSIIDYVISSNPKNGRSNGQPTQQGWGAVKIEFKALFKLLASKNKSLIFTAHEIMEKIGEETMIMPECAGSSRKDILKELDLIGYMKSDGNKRAIYFCRLDGVYTKNSLEITNTLYIEDSRVNNWFQKNLFDKNMARLERETEEVKKYTKLKETIEKGISAISDVASINDYYNNIIGKHDKIWDSAPFEKGLLNKKMKELNLEFDKEKKEFKEFKETKEDQVDDVKTLSTFEIIEKKLTEAKDKDSLEKIKKAYNDFEDFEEKEKLDNIFNAKLKEFNE